MGIVFAALGKALLGLIGSKKAIVTVVGLLTSYVLLPFLNGKLALGLTSSEIQDSLYAFIALVTGYAAEDFGKATKKKETYDVG